MMVRPEIPFLLVPFIALFLVVLGFVFDQFRVCRRFAPLCRFMCVGILLGCAAGITGEFLYDFIEPWLFRTLPFRSLATLIDFVFDCGPAPTLGILSGAASAIWFWYIRPPDPAVTFKTSQ